MSVRIRLSYSDDKEFEAIRQRLSDLRFTIKIPPQTGRYKRAYFNLKTVLQEPATADDLLKDIPPVDEEFPL